jgi:hypothetical protein
MGADELVNASPTPTQVQAARSSLSPLVTEDLQGRVNALATALILQGYEPTLVRMRAGIGRVSQVQLRRAFDHWKVQVRPNIGRGPGRNPTWGNEIPVPEAIRGLFCETWRKTLIAARMTQNFSDESLEKVTVSDEARAIKACVQQFEAVIREHVEQRRVEAEVIRALTLRLANTCADWEGMHTKAHELFTYCRHAAEALRYKLLNLGSDIESVQLKMQSFRKDLSLLSTNTCAAQVNPKRVRQFSVSKRKVKARRSRTYTRRRT